MIRACILGGAGFIGAALSRRLLDAGASLTIVDDLSTGSPANIPAGVRFLERDVRFIKSEDIGPHDIWFNLASPTGPQRVMEIPVKTLLTNIAAAKLALDAVVLMGGRVVQASTAEIYGEPEVHPQPETYVGHVDPCGLRAGYDEGKRAAEALCYAYWREYRAQISVARLFNVYGPGMQADDGRIVPNFVVQALRGGPLTVYGDGLATRSLCYVDDIVDGLLLLAERPTPRPVNLGNPEEMTVLAIAEAVLEAAGVRAPVVHLPPLASDTRRRCPDIALAMSMGWRPTTTLRAGLAHTVDHFRKDARAQDHRGHRSRSG